MVIIQGKLIEEDILHEHFLCNLHACKGACCWEGEYGAPLDDAERHTLEDIYDDIAPYLSETNKAVLREQGLYTYYKDMNAYGTPLQENGACAYLTVGEDGIARCGIEQAWQDGATDFRKPISCHLYPIRITQDRHTGIERMRYDRWDICSAACALGKKKQLPLYAFAKDALTRKYGAAFFEELEAYAKFRNEQEETGG